MIVNEYFETLLKVKDDISTKHYQILEDSTKREPIYLYFIGAKCFFNGHEIKFNKNYLGNFCYEKDKKVYCYIDGTGENIIPIPESDDEWFNLYILTGATKEYSEIFFKMIEIYENI